MNPPKLSKKSGQVNVPVGVLGIEPSSRKFLMEISTEVSQTSGQVHGRGARIRTGSPLPPKQVC